MRTLHVGLRVSDRERSLAFYTALGYEVVGSVVDTGIGHLTMLKLPDDPFVTIELVSGSPDRSAAPSGGSGGASGLSHLVIEVPSMSRILTRLAAAGIATEEATSPDGSEDFLTSDITDPDGHWIELVQWPSGHPVGMTAADFVQ